MSFSSDLSRRGALSILDRSSIDNGIDGIRAVKTNTSDLVGGNSDRVATSLTEPSPSPRLHVASFSDIRLATTADVLPERLQIVLALSRNDFARHDFTSLNVY
jgi:hypothetical protein